MRWEAEVEAVEAGQRVEAGDSLVEAAGPVLGEGEVGGGGGEGDQVLNSFTPHSETELGDCSEEEMSL